MDSRCPRVRTGGKLCKKELAPGWSEGIGSHPRGIRQTMEQEPLGRALKWVLMQAQRFDTK